MEVFKSLLIIFLGILASFQLNAHQNIKTSRLGFSRATVGTSAVAVVSTAPGKRVYGWMICHDPDSTPTFIVISEAADPATDGFKLAPGECYICDDCGGGVLGRLRVKAQAAGATYSVVQKNP